jgi:phosphoglycerate dehydrogenase-like enzyme
VVHSDVAIVIPGDDPPQLQGSPHLARLKSYGEVILYVDRPSTVEDKVRRAGNAVCLINSRGAVKWPAEVLRRLSRLKMITVCGIGTDAIDLETAKELGIIVCNLPGQTAPIVAEHALGLMLALAKRAWFQTSELKSGRWTSQDNVYLRGKTLGLVGAGNIAAELARLGKAIGMEVLAWTFHPTPERAARLGVTFVSLQEMMSRSDVVSLHMKLTSESRGLIGVEQIGWMKRGAMLINTARGPILDSKALVDALNSGQLGGAGIDVFDAEPIAADHPLLACQQVVLTPHNADQTPEGMELLNAGVVDNVIAFLQGHSRNRVV